MNTFESGPTKKPELLSEDLLNELSEKKEKAVREYMGTELHSEVLMLKALVEKLSLVPDDEDKKIAEAIQTFHKERTRIMSSVQEKDVYFDDTGVVRNERIAE